MSSTPPDLPDDPSSSPIVRRIVRKSGIPSLAETLVSKLSLSDLQSLLLHVYKQRAASLQVAGLLRQYEVNRFVKPPKITPAETTAFDTLAFGLLPEGFEAIELSPVCPLGTSSVLGPVDQDLVLTTVRNTEVLSDPTNAMALECAVRRKKNPARSPETEIKLACSQRLVRAQTFEGPATFAHFRMLALCTAGRDSGGLAFETRAGLEHADYYVRLLKALDRAGHHSKNIRLRLIPSSGPAASAAGTIEESLRRRHPDVTCETEGGGSAAPGYYDGLRFQIFASTAAGEEVFLADGGLTDWTQKLLNNRKERLMTSGMGTERFLFCFGGKA